MTAVVLAYHRVARLERDIHGLAITPDAFREEIAWLRKQCNPVPLDRVIDSAGSSSTRNVAVTLDDGYCDNLTEASGILMEFGVPATFFVTTERLDDAHFEYWWDRLARIVIDSGGSDQLTINIDGRTQYWPMTTVGARLEAYRSLHRALVHSNVDARDRLLQTLEAWAAVPSGAPHGRRMAADDIRELAQRPGHSIGVHTDRHLYLPAQAEAIQRKEVARSADALERVLQARPAAFAYPFGAPTVAAADEVRRLKLRLAVTLEERPVRLDEDAFLIPRFEVTHDRAARFGSWMESLFDA